MSTAAGSTHSIALDPDAQRVIEERRARRLDRLARRDRATLIVSVSLFLVVAGALAVLIPTERDPSVFTVALLIGAYALAFRLDFEISKRLGRPDAADPRADVLRAADRDGAARGCRRDVLAELRSSTRAGRFTWSGSFSRLQNAWHAVGPALVLGLAR